MPNDLHVYRVKVTPELEVGDIVWVTRTVSRTISEVHRSPAVWGMPEAFVVTFLEPADEHWGHANTAGHETRWWVSW